MTARILLACAYVAMAVAALAWSLWRGQVASIAVAVLACAAPLAGWALLRAPHLVLGVAVGVVGLMPYATIPGTGQYVVYPVALLVALAAALHPRSDRAAIGRTVPAFTIAYLAVSGLSAVATTIGVGGIVEYVQWAIATAPALAIVLLRDDLRRAIARGFVVGVAVGSIVAVAQMTIDPAGSWLGAFGLLGYGTTDDVVTRTAVVDGEEVVRSTGFYVDPNAGALFMLFAIGLASVAFRGRWRVLLAAIPLVGVVATLSRSAILTLAVAAFVLFLVRRQSAGARALVGAVGAVGIVVALAVPTIRERLLALLDGGDVGADARADAFARFPQHLEGRWLFGRGWRLPEFEDAYYGYTINHVAHTPLLVVYRGGIVDGIVFVALLVVLVVVCVRALRRRLPEADLLAPVLVAVTLVAFQLDFPVVTMQPLAFAFALVVGCVAALDRRLESCGGVGALGARELEVGVR